jgi:hypothetical protein
VPIVAVGPQRSAPCLRLSASRWKARHGSGIVPCPARRERRRAAPAGFEPHNAGDPFARLVSRRRQDRSPAWQGMRRLSHAYPEIGISSCDGGRPAFEPHRGRTRWSRWSQRSSLPTPADSQQPATETAEHAHDFTAGANLLEMMPPTSMFRSRRHSYSRSATKCC